MKKRLFYLMMTAALLIIEVLIALYVHDDFIRPYIGDVIVVIVIYSFIRIFIPDGFRALPICIFIFAVIVEVLQYFNIVGLLGLSENRFMRVLIGGTFDWKDIACYGAGCLLLGLYELLIRLLGAGPEG